MAYGFKTGGRQKGTPNKNTGAVSENLRAIFMDEFESGRVQQALQQLEPEDYIAALLKWSQFVFPKPRPSNNAAEPHTPGEPATETSTTETPATLEEPQPNEEEMALITVQENLRKRLVGTEIERFRLHMGWTEEEVQRFIDGEPVESIGWKE